MTAQDHAHAKLAPSSASRWLACPASVKFSEHITAEYGRPEAGAAAVLGTKLHDQADAILKGKLTLQDVDEEHRDMLAIYIGYVTQRKAKASGQSDLHLEVRLYHPTVHPEVWGTGDAIIVDKERQHLEVIDLKTGVGGVVAENNWQLLTYAALARGFFDVDPETIKLTIVQPRAMDGLKAIRTWEIDKRQLDDASAELRFGAKLVFSEAGEHMFNPGPSACQWCPGRGHCKAQKDLEIVQDFYEGPSSKMLSNEQMAEMVAAIPQIEAYIRDLKSAAEQRLRKGDDIPGLKMVESRTQRRWADTEAAMVYLSGVANPGDYTEIKLKPFNSVLKAVPPMVQEELEEQHIIKPRGAPTVAPEDDRRPALDLETIAALEAAQKP